MRSRISGKPKSLADKAVAFINALTHTGDYNGVPFKLRPWQEQIVRDIFRTDAKGSRIVRKGFIALPRKQGKTELIAAILLFLLVGLGRKGQHIYSASGSRDQASLIFRAASSMVRNNPTLAKVCLIHDTYKRISYERGESFYEAVSSDAGLKHGLSPSAVLFDELHVLPDRELFDVMTTGFGARREPLTLMITTAGHNRHSICFEQWEYARKVKKGLIDNPQFLPVLFEAGPEDDWKDEETWRKCMPALGDFCSLDFIREEARKAQELPSFENTFRQLYLNQWTAQAVRWLPMDKWKACGESREGKTTPLFKGLPCYGGLDLSSTTDLSALVLTFPLGDEIHTLCKFWAPEEGADIRERRDGVPYREWAKKGLIKLTPGAVVDYSYIREEILELSETYDLRRLFCDPYNATQLCIELQQSGIPVEFIRQGFLSLSAPTKELERLVLSGRLRHYGDEILAWCADNVVVEKDAAGNIKPSKKHSTERIDGIAALVNSIAALKSDDKDRGPSVYENRGILVL